MRGGSKSLGSILDCEVTLLANSFPKKATFRQPRKKVGGQSSSKLQNYGFYAFNLKRPFSFASNPRTAITQTLDSISSPKSYQINLMYSLGAGPFPTRVPPIGEPHSAPRPRMK